jgi:hypothetical protein
MLISYSSYKNDIESFNSEEYIQNLQNLISLDYFNNFIEVYKDIENEDFKKPVFSQTSKFKKNPSNYKNYKYLKIVRDNNEPKKSWSFEAPKDESEKISILVKTYLNKITQDTYKKISTEFIDQILLIENQDLFNILSHEILNKCLFDNKYRNLYINLCFKIWTNKKIHNNLILVTNKDNTFLWETSNDKSKNSFSSEENARNDAYNKINFKRHFVNYIHKLYQEKDFSFENMSDEEIFIKKKKILLLVELIGILYVEKYINFDIINIIIIDLLHINDNFKEINEIEFEALYNLTKLIKESKSTFNDLEEYKNLFNHYTSIINQIILADKVSKRSNFFLSVIADTFEIFKNEKKNTVKLETAMKDKEDKNINLLEAIKNNSNIVELLSIYKKIENDKDKLSKSIYQVIDLFISQKNKNKVIIDFINEIKNNDLVFENVNQFIENIDDIMLDVPDAKNKMIIFLEGVKDKRSVERINYLKNLDSDDESEE